MNRERIQDAAVLLNCLTPDEAAAIVSHLSGDLAAQIEQAKSELNPDARPGAQVLAQFAARLAAQPDDGPTGPVAGNLAGTPTKHRATLPLDQPFAMLNDTDPAALAETLEQESPQLIAVVAANLSPPRAAELMSHFSKDVRGQVLACIGNLRESDSRVLRQLEAKLELLFGNIQEKSAKPEGEQRLAAILAAAARSNREQILHSLEARDRDLARRVSGGIPHSPVPASQPGPAPTPTDSDRTIASPPVPVISDAGRPAGSSTEAAVAGNPRPADHVPPRAERPIDPSNASVTVELHRMLQLSEASLGRVFREVNRQTMCLALAGANSTFVQRLLKRLPPREARMWKREMQNLGPVRLDDIRRAQCVVAEYTLHIIQQSATSSQGRSFAISA